MNLFRPDEYYKTIHDIDLLALYEKGFRLILTDLDNTLVGYDQSLPTKEIIEFKRSANELGMKVVVISNNKEERVNRFATELEVDYTSRAKKPLKISYKKYLKDFRKEEIVIVGDQLLTDILGGNRMGFHTILVDVINYKNEQIGTRINRAIESFILRRIKIKNKG